MDVLEFYSSEVPKILGVDVNVWCAVIDAIAEKEAVGEYFFSHEYFLKIHGPEKCYRERAKGLMPYAVEADKKEIYDYFLDLAEYYLMKDRVESHLEKSKFVNDRMKSLIENFDAKDLTLAKSDRW